MTLDREYGFFDANRRWAWVVIIFLFAAAGGLRLLHLDDSTVIAERQYRSALIARLIYFDASPPAAEWREDVARVSVDRKVVLEPPIFETIVASIYRVLGRESLDAARILSVTFWIIGAFFLLDTTKRLCSMDAALYAVAFYLFVPLGVEVSTSFLPDPLMLGLMLAGLWGITRYFEGPSLRRLLMAAGLCASSIFVKPLGLFVLLAAFYCALLARYGFHNKTTYVHGLIFLAISVGLGTSYYAYGTLVANYLHWQVQASFKPQLLVERAFWYRWFDYARWTVGLAPVVLGLMAIPLHKKDWRRALVCGLWLGYLAFCLAFTYHVQITGHYHLQLVIVAGISVSPLIAMVLRQMLAPGAVWLGAPLAIFASLLALFFMVRDFRHDLRNRTAIETAAVAREIGEIVDHGTRNLFVSPYYGGPLEYLAEIAGDYWPTHNEEWMFGKRVDRPLSVTERFDLLDFELEYFIVTDFTFFEQRHPDIATYLSANCDVVAHTPDYLIYGRCVRG